MGKITDKDLLLLFAYAPSGLGHLRVTDALYHGLPAGTNPLILGAQDKSISFFHRFMSIHIVTRNIMEWTQRGFGEDVFTYLYKHFLRSKSKLLYQQITTILDEEINPPKTVLIVATHFGLAHQLSAIKQKLETDRKIKIFLIVQVTDDSPQHLWYIDGADIIFVPSEETKINLLEYGQRSGLKRVSIQVNPYPISPYLATNLTPEKLHNRIQQINPDSKSLIHIAIPISGAAVGTGYLTKLIYALHKTSNRFVFHIVAKNAMYNQQFLQRLKNKDYINTYISQSDRETVDAYEKLYLNEIISLEITKPSEQAFKTLFKPSEIGGSILLFSKPIGRQEYDNLDFLRRHFLIPKKHQQKFLWDYTQEKQLLEQFMQWRGLFLPENPTEAAKFILYLLEQKIFLSMMKHERPHDFKQHTNEINPFGVKLFWEKVDEFLKDKF